MNDTTTAQVPYWTPTGIIMAEPPPAYVALSNDDESDWHKLLAKHGYKSNGRIWH